MKKILTAIICFWALNGFGQPKLLESDGLVVYPFNINSTDPAKLSYLDSIIQPYNIFGVAEYHWSETTLKEEKKFITYIAHAKGLDKIVIERPFAYGYWINEYLATGDTLLLKTVVDKYWVNDYYLKKTIRYLNYYEFYKWLYAFKKEKGLTFKVIGIDLDQTLNGSLELWSIKQFIERYSLSHYFVISYPELEKICLKPRPKFSELKKWHKTFKAELVESDKIVKNILKNDYVDFIKITKGIDAILNYGKSMDAVFRENNMARNFIKEIDSTDIVYAQFGHLHLARGAGERYKVLNGFNGGFISKVENNSKFTSKVLSVYFLCKGCKVAGETTTHKGIFTQDEYDKIFDALDGKSALIDFRNAKNGFSDIHTYFQLSIFLNGEN